MINSINKAIAWLVAITIAIWLFLAGFNLGPFALVFSALAITWWRFVLWDASNKNWFYIAAKEDEGIWSVSGKGIPKKVFLTSADKKLIKNRLVEAKGRKPGVMNGPGIFGSGIYPLPNAGIVGGIKILFRRMSWLEYEQKEKEFDLIPRKDEETPYIYTKISNYAVVLTDIEDMDGLKVGLIIGIPGKFVDVNKPVFKVDQPFARIQNILQDAVLRTAIEELSFDFMTDTSRGKNGQETTSQNILRRKATFERIKEVVMNCKEQLIDEIGFEIIQSLIISFELSGEFGKKIYEKLAGVETARLDKIITVTNAEAEADAAVEKARGTRAEGKAKADVIKEVGTEENKILKERKEQLGETGFAMNQFNEGMSNFGGEALAINIGSDAKSNLQFVKPIGGGGNKGNGNTPPKKTRQKK